MIDFIAEIVGGIFELIVDLLIEPWIDRLRGKRRQKKRESSHG